MVKFTRKTIQFIGNFKIGLANPWRAPKYKRAGHFGLWQLAASWERSASPSRLSSEALDACTLTGPVRSCCLFVSLGKWTPKSRFGSACG